MKVGAFLLIALRMLVLLGFSILSTFVLRLYAPDSSAPVISQFHSVCLNACPSGDHAELYRAVVCGGRLDSQSIRHTFAQLGLIHLLVVSGSHFVVLQTLLRFTVLKCTPLRARDACVFSILLLFTLMTKASPPVLRAFLMFCLLAVNSRFSFNWSRLQTLTIAGFTTLPFCRDRWQLCSLFLSWLAALALEKIETPVENSPASLREKFMASIVTNTRVYFLLIPPLLLLTVPHPLSILANVLFAPVMGLVLFPLSLAVVVLPFLTFAGDFVWSLVLQVCKSLSNYMPEDFGQAAYPSELLVFYLAGLTLLVTAWKRRPKVNRSAVAMIIFVLALPFREVQANSNETPQLVVWNVGQGSWATITSADECHHFDLGGEYAPWPAVRKLCRGKTNVVSFSHWDLDHVGFATKAVRTLPNLCIQHRPLGGAPNVFRAHSLDEMPDCKRRDPTLELFSRADLMKTSNGRSRVFLTHSILFPGDSGSSEEKIWAKRPEVKVAKILLAGHHGSRTATSSFLLRRLINAKLIIASARRERFGHPSHITRKRIGQAKLPLLTTEDWGSIHIELRTSKDVRGRNKF